MKDPNRGVLIAGNWKMNHGIQETQTFLRTLLTQKPLSHSSEKFRACIFPSYLSLPEAQRTIESQKNSIHVGAQSAHWEKKGAFTGEVSGAMLHELGIGWVLVGHSERRQYFGETDETVHRRAQSLLEQGFHVILCIGETLKERQEGLTEEVLKRQIEKGAPKIQDMKDLRGELILAYEPVWAIGTGQTATTEQAQSAHQWIRHILETHLNPEWAMRTQILYGGSVTPENISALLQCPDIDGALVGGASLKPESFASLLEQAQQLA